MPETPLLFIGLGWLVPLGFALIAAGGLPEESARQATLSVLAALGLALTGYLAVGFALQFGGIGLLYEQPDFDGLIWEWSALGTMWGRGWGMVGMAGWGLTGPAATPAAYRLALGNLPWVTTAALIPVLSLRGRVPAWAAGLTALIAGAVVYPLAGNWTWGGGWLANIGANLGLGHGLVDVAGTGIVHVVGASAALAGIVVFLPRRAYPRSSDPVPLPPVHLPLLAVAGACFLLAGGLGWVLSNPLLDRNLDLSLLALNLALAAAGGALLPLVYAWFVTGKADPLMTTRGLAAAYIVGLAIAPFVPPWAALASGAATGLLLPLCVYALDRVFGIDDATAALSVHGLGGIAGLLGVAVLADGRHGAGWNGMGATSYLGVNGQGVTGWLAAQGFAPDWPGQLQAQAIGLVSLALLGFFAVWLVLAPPAIALRLVRTRGAALTLARRTAGPTPAPSAEHSPEAPTIGAVDPIEDITPPAAPTLADGEGAV